jgi:hypothetical protein
VSLAGPTVRWSNPSAYTATINLSGSEGPILSFSGCSTPASVEYLNFNGGQPSPDGGQALYFPAGTSNMTVSYNFFQGNQGNTTNPQFVDGLVYFDGDSSATVSANNTISWNIFGNPFLSDCSNLMTNYTYPSGYGGLCSGLGIHNGMSNLVVENNIFQFEEQGMKIYETTGQCTNCTIAYNEFNNIHRISFETQANIGASQPTSMSILYNDVHDQFDGSSASMGISAANGCSDPTPINPTNCATQANYNVLINNILVSGPPGGYVPEALEVFGGSGTTASYNLIQGYWANGIMTGTNGQFVYNNNNFFMYFGLYPPPGSTSCDPGPDGYWGYEAVSGSYLPSCTGNTFSTSPTGAQTSVAPTVSPASGTFTASQTITFTDPGTGRDANTGIWYTTDGSTPVPGSGTAKYISSGGTISVRSTTTVKAVGMWGAENQPVSYASGYGYVPSAVRIRVYTREDDPPTLVSAYVSGKGGATSMTTGGTLQFTAYGTYSDGTVEELPDLQGNAVTLWNTSNHAVAKISTLGHATAMGPGTANIEATIGTIMAAPWKVTVSDAETPAP